MEIDFHHAVTHIVARLAGFTPEQARIIGHSAQYVDDATSSGEILFSNGGAYTRISSAHKMLDYRNFKNLANANVWLPFHFLPGNGGVHANSSPRGRFIHKLVCRPDSPIAREMVERCANGHGSPGALHRLGISMHVYADTWAHQGFAGVSHAINIVKDLIDEDGALDEGFINRLRTFFGDQFEALQSAVADNLPLGHGAALSHPDKPYLKWHYTNGLGDKIHRDNPKDYLAATREMFHRLVEYRQKAGEQNVSTELPTADFAQIERNIAAFREPQGEERHRRWCQSLAAGDFSSGAESIDYIAKGKGSWKHIALQTTENDPPTGDGYEFSPAFLSSDWKYFHDALQRHRLVVLHDILPRYGICAA